MALLLSVLLAACDASDRNREAREAEATFARDVEAMQQHRLARSERCDHVRPRITIFRRLRDTIRSCLEEAAVPAYVFHINVGLSRSGVTLRSLDGAAPLIPPDIQEACIQRPVQALRLDSPALLDNFHKDDLWPSYELEMARAPGLPAQVSDRTQCSTPLSPTARAEVTALDELRDVPFVVGSSPADDRVTKALRACEQDLRVPNPPTPLVAEIELRGISGQPPRESRCVRGPDDELSPLQQCYCEAFRDHLPNAKPEPVTIEAVTPDGRTVRARPEVPLLPVTQRWWLVRMAERPEDAPRFYSLRRRLPPPSY